jgi:hypothetical protein
MLLWLLPIAGRALGAQHPLVSVPLSDPVYLQLRGLNQSGCRSVRVSPFRPYSVEAIRDAIRAAAREPVCSGPLLRAMHDRFIGPADTTTSDSSARRVERGIELGAKATVQGTGLSGGEFRPLWRDVRPTSEGTPPAVASVHGRATWSGGRPVVAVVDAYAQTHRRNDPRVRAGGLRSTSGFVDFSEAYLTGELGALTISIGRGAEAWLGAGDESLLIGAHGPPIDRILLAAKVGRVEGRAFIATIDDVTMTVEEDGLPAGTPPLRFNRLLLGHALTFATAGGVEFTLAETAILARGSSTFDLAFMNPLMPFLVTQNDEANDEDAQDNIAVIGAVRVPVGRAAFDAELLVDDYQLDEGDRAIYPHQLGWRVAGTFGIAAPVPASVAAEYRRLDGFTYLRSEYPVVFQSYDEPVASELGPDADMIRVGGEVWPSGQIRAYASGGYWRRGAQRIDQRPADGARDHANEPYPTITTTRPDVQRGVIGVVGAERLGVSLQAGGRVEVARVDNTNNVAAAARTFARFVIELSYAFRYP